LVLLLYFLKISSLLSLTSALVHVQVSAPYINMGM
jgi:hypothetical protein